MIFKIKKGNHWPGLISWIRAKWFRFSKKPFTIRRRITLYPDCKYNLPLLEDMTDVNKLFGAGFPFVHKESARIGWNYDVESGRFLFYAYCFVNGVRQFEYLGDVGLMEQPIIATIDIKKDCYLFTIEAPGRIVTKDYRVSKIHNGWAASCGVFFGGNNPAPQNMTIEISKL